MEGDKPTRAIETEKPTPIETEKATHAHDLPHDFAGITGKCSICGSSESDELHNAIPVEKAAASNLVVTEKGS